MTSNETPETDVAELGRINIKGDKKLIEKLTEEKGKAQMDYSGNSIEEREQGKDGRDNTKPEEKRIEGMIDAKGVIVPRGEHWTIKGAVKCEFTIEPGAKLTLEGSMKNKVIIEKGGVLDIEGGLKNEIIRAEEGNSSEQFPEKKVFEIKTKAAKDTSELGIAANETVEKAQGLKDEQKEDVTKKTEEITMRGKGLSEKLREDVDSVIENDENNKWTEDISEIINELKRVAGTDFEINRDSMEEAMELLSRYGTMERNKDSISRGADLKINRKQAKSDLKELRKYSNLLNVIRNKVKKFIEEDRSSGIEITDIGKMTAEEINTKLKEIGPVLADLEVSSKRFMKEDVFPYERYNELRDYQKNLRTKKEEFESGKKDNVKIKEAYELPKDLRLFLVKDANDEQKEIALRELSNVIGEKYNFEYKTIDTFRIDEAKDEFAKVHIETKDGRSITADIYFEFKKERIDVTGKKGTEKERPEEKEESVESQEAGPKEIMKELRDIYHKRKDLLSAYGKKLKNKEFKDDNERSEEKAKIGELNYRINQLNYKYFSNPEFMEKLIKADRIFVEHRQDEIRKGVFDHGMLDTTVDRKSVGDVQMRRVEDVERMSVEEINTELKIVNDKSLDTKNLDSVTAKELSQYAEILKFELGQKTREQKAEKKKENKKAEKEVVLGELRSRIKILGEADLRSLRRSLEDNRDEQIIADRYQDKVFKSLIKGEIDFEKIKTFTIKEIKEVAENVYEERMKEQKTAEKVLGIEIKSEENIRKMKVDEMEKECDNIGTKLVELNTRDKTDTSFPSAEYEKLQNYRIFLLKIRNETVENIISTNDTKSGDIVKTMSDQDLNSELQKIQDRVAKIDKENPEVKNTNEYKRLIENLETIEYWKNKKAEEEKSKTEKREREGQGEKLPVLGVEMKSYEDVIKMSPAELKAEIGKTLKETEAAAKKINSMTSVADAAEAKKESEILNNYLGFLEEHQGYLAVSNIPKREPVKNLTKEQISEKIKEFESFFDVYDINPQKEGSGKMEVAATYYMDLLKKKKGEAEKDREEHKWIKLRTGALDTSLEVEKEYLDPKTSTQRKEEILKNIEEGFQKLDVSIVDDLKDYDLPITEENKAKAQKMEREIFQHLYDNLKAQEKPPETETAVPKDNIVFGIKIKTSEELEKMSKEELQKEGDAVLSRVEELQKENKYQTVDETGKANIITNVTGTEDFKKLNEYLNITIADIYAKKAGLESKEPAEVKEETPRNVGGVVDKLRRFEWELHEEVAKIEKENWDLVNRYEAGEKLGGEETKRAKEVERLSNLRDRASLNTLAAELAASSFEKDPRKRRESIVNISGHLDGLLKMQKLVLMKQETELNRVKLEREKGASLGNFISAIGRGIKDRIFGRSGEAKTEKEEKEPKKEGEGKSGGIGITEFIKKKIPDNKYTKFIKEKGAKLTGKKETGDSADMEELNHLLEGVNNPEDLKKMFIILQNKIGEGKFDRTSPLSKYERRMTRLITESDKESGLNWYATALSGYEKDTDPAKDVEFFKALSEDREIVQNLPNGALKAFMTKVFDKIEELQKSTPKNKAAEKKEVKEEKTLEGEIKSLGKKELERLSSFLSYRMSQGLIGKNDLASSLISEFKMESQYKKLEELLEKNTDLFRDLKAGELRDIVNGLLEGKTEQKEKGTDKEAAKRDREYQAKIEKEREIRVEILEEIFDPAEIMNATDKERLKNLMIKNEKGWRNIMLQKEIGEFGEGFWAYAPKYTDTLIKTIGSLRYYLEKERLDENDKKRLKEELEYKYKGKEFEQITSPRIKNYFDVLINKTNEVLDIELEPENEESGNTGQEKDDKAQINEVLNENRINEIKQAGNLDDLKEIIRNAEINLRPIAAAEKYGRVMKSILDKDHEMDLKREIVENIIIKEGDDAPEFFKALNKKLFELDQKRRNSDRKES